MASNSIRTVTPEEDRSESALTRRRLAVLTGVSLLGVSGCASIASEVPQPTLQLPLRQGWFDGETVFYITTDVSDADVAAMQGANYAPRLAHTLPRQRAQPGQPSSVDRVYEVTNFKQSSVFASAPRPMGAANREHAYSPLWRMVVVKWQPGQTPQALTSEEQVLAAEERGAVQLAVTNVVLNCPIVYRVGHGGIRGVELRP